MLPGTPRAEAGEMRFGRTDASDGDAMAIGDDSGNMGGGGIDPELDEGLPPDDPFASLGPMTDEERIDVYARSDLTLQRLILAKGLVPLAQSVGFEVCTAKLVPHVHTLSRDPVGGVRLALAGALPGLAEYLMGPDGGESGANEVVAAIVPVLTRLLQDPESQQLRERAALSFVEVARRLSKEDLESRVVPMLRGMMDSDDATLRMTAPYIVSELAEVIGEELCRDHLVPEVTKLAKDAMFRVRKTVAQHFGGLCAVVGPTFSKDALLPVYLELASDEIWGVRKACAESMVSVAQALSPDDRAAHMVPVFERFSEDVSRWVRNCAYQHLGPLLATLSPEQITPGLLEMFTSMADPQKSAEDSDIFSYCAFNIPAVALTVGRARWPELAPAYQRLVKDVQWKVRRTLSHSLAAMAEILGRDLSEQCLLTVLDLFLRDLDEVKVGAVRRLPAFLAVLGPAARDRYLPALADLAAESRDAWRMRKCVARQVGPVSKLYTPPQVVGQILPVALALCADGVASVRREAVVSMGSVLLALSGSSLASSSSSSLSSATSSKSSLSGSGSASLGNTNTNGGDGARPSTSSEGDANSGDGASGGSGDGTSPSASSTGGASTGSNSSSTSSSSSADAANAATSTAFDEAVRQVLAFATDGNFQRRQLFVSVAEQAVRDLPAGMAERAFGDALATLASDPVANVRIRVACLLHAAQRQGKLSSPRLTAAVKTLMADRDEDVAYFAKNGGEGTTAASGAAVPSDADDDGEE